MFSDQYTQKRKTQKNNIKISFYYGYKFNDSDNNNDPDKNINRWVFKLTKPKSNFLKRFFGMEDRLGEITVDYGSHNYNQKQPDGSLKYYGTGYRTFASVDHDFFKTSNNTDCTQCFEEILSPEDIAKTVYEVCKKYQYRSGQPEILCDEMHTATKDFFTKHKEAFSKEPCVENFRKS